RINKGGVDYLALSPTEFNLLGTGRRLYSSLGFGRRTYSLGSGVTEPRLSGSHIELSGTVDATIGCASATVEGSHGSFDYKYPLYSTRSTWSYGTSIGWRNGRAPLDIPNNALGSICSLRAPEEATARGVGWLGKSAYYPNLYIFDSQSFSQYFTRSYGVRYKTNLSFG